MKKTTITILAAVMGISFICLLALQVYYIEEVLDLRRLHFVESVNRSLLATAHELELDEATRYLNQGSDAIEGIAMASDSIMVTTDSAFIQRIHTITAKDGSAFSTIQISISLNAPTKKTNPAHWNPS